MSVVVEGAHREALEALIRRAEALTADEARQIASAVAWRWVPLGLPMAGSVAAARSTAVALGRGAGRGDAIAAAQAQAQAAVRRSPGVQATRRGFLSGETAFALVLLGLVGSLASAAVEAIVLAIAFGLVGLVGAAALLLLESAYVLRLRVDAAVSAAALALATEDLIEPGTAGVLAGPWRSVIHG